MKEIIRNLLNPKEKTEEVLITKEELKDKIKKLEKEITKLKSKEPEYLIEKLKERKSIRKFSGKDIPWEKIYKIIESAYTAPAAGNIKNYKFIIIKDKETRKEISNICFQQYWIADAPYIIVVVRDDTHLIELYPNFGKRYSIQNTAVAIENLLLSAHYFGFGACWVEGYNNEVLKDFLGIPQHLYVDAIIPIGYPLENPKRDLINLNNKIYFEKYNNIKKTKEYK